MSDKFESDIKNYLASKNKPVVQFKVSNVLDEPTSNRRTERRLTSEWINKQIRTGGFIVGAIVTGKQIGRASCRERVSSPV